MGGILAQALGSALVLATVAILVTLRKQRRSKGTYYYPALKKLEAWHGAGDTQGEATKRCRFCLEEADLKAVSVLQKEPRIRRALGRKSVEEASHLSQQG